MRKLRTALAILVPIVFVAVVAGLAAWYLHGRNVAVLQPAGAVGLKERQLIDLAMILSVVVVVPVFALAIFIAWRYRETNPRVKKYQPEWDHSRLYETVWWGIPAVIITILSVVTWVSSHQLDPYRSLVSSKPPLHVQVVSLDWKWLFIYPDQHVASVNELYLPVGRPVSFDITSDSVMNSFWIPSLGSQIYAMPGMSTKLHLIADKPGTYYGSPANITGRGYAGMVFGVHATTQNGFAAWVRKAQAANRNLTDSNYTALARPSTNNKVIYFSPVQDDLYDGIVMKYMSHGIRTAEGVTMPSGHGGMH